MQDHRNTDPTAPRRVPWNKGKLIGAKPLLRQGNRVKKCVTSR